MRYYLRKIVIVAIALTAAHTLIPTVVFGPDFKNILIAVAALLIVNLFIKPLFSLVLIPINLFTLGSISLLLNIAAIFALIYLLPGFSIQPFYFKGADIEGIIFPSYFFNQISTIILFAATFTIVQKALHFIFE